MVRGDAIAEVVHQSASGNHSIVAHKLHHGVLDANNAANGIFFLIITDQKTIIDIFPLRITIISYFCKVIIAERIERWV